MSEPTYEPLDLDSAEDELRGLMDRVTRRFFTRGHQPLSSTVFFALNDLFKSWGPQADQLAALLPAAALSLGATFEVTTPRNDASYTPEEPTWQSYLTPALTRMIMDHLYHTRPEVAEEDARRLELIRAVTSNESPQEAGIKK